MPERKAFDEGTFSGAVGYQEYNIDRDTDEDFNRIMKELEQLGTLRSTSIERDSERNDSAGPAGTAGAVASGNSPRTKADHLPNPTTSSQRATPKKKKKTFKERRADANEFARLALAQASSDGRGITDNEVKTLLEK